MKIIVATAAAVGACLVITADHASAALPPDVTALMDLSVDPCDDFYQYACGGWMKNATIPDGIDRVRFPYDQLADLATDEINEVLEARHPILGEFYDSCLDTKKTATTNGNKPIQAALSKIESVSSKLELAKLAGEFGTQGTWLFTSFNFANDDRDPRWNAFLAESIGSPLSEVPKDKVNAASKYILTTLKLGGVKVPGDGKQVATSILDINRIFVEVSPAVTGPDAQKDMLRLKEAENRFPLSFKAIADGAQVRSKSAIKDDSVIFINSLSFFTAVESKIWNAKSLDEIKFFFLFVYINQFANYLGDEFIANENEYWGPPDDRVVRCRRAVWELLPDLINEYYFKKALGTQTQHYVKEMAQTLNYQMIDFISKQSWISSSARTEAQKKLQNVVTLVGKQDQPVSYPLKLKSDTLVDNFRAVIQYKFHIGLQGLGSLVDRTAWDGAPGDTSVCFAPSLVQLTVTTGMLQAPFFSSGYHIARQYGGLAATLSAVTAAAIGPEGVTYDSNGAKRDWLNQQDKQHFKKRFDCFRDQYSQYEVHGSNGNAPGHVNGSLTLDSAVSDDSGIRFGFRGLQQFLAKNPNTPSQGLTPDEINRLFFIAAGQQWCAKSTDADLADLLKNDPHAPPAARVNVVLGNNDDFAKVFNCKAGAKMNPIKKCGVWQ